MKVLVSQIQVPLQSVYSVPLRQTLRYHWDLRASGSGVIEFRETLSDENVNHFVKMEIPTATKHSLDSTFPKFEFYRKDGYCHNLGFVKFNYA